MNRVNRGIALVFSACLSISICPAQDLRPRAYVITPVHSNAVILSYSFSDGSIFFGSVFPITNNSGRYSVPSLSYYHSFSFFKRSANFTASLPYVVGHFQGTVSGNEEKIYRSGMTDSIYRFSVNLIGGPALPVHEFAKWRQKTILGASIEVGRRRASTPPVTWSTRASTAGLSNRSLAYLEDGGIGSWMHMEASGCSPRTTTT